ncbi:MULTISPECIES: NAD(P)-dependent oxidoreductase [unclassified Nocardia]|uniref:NAD(P)-dependent oxidoreductase n=1 Tax=unclassified Nocardia TaxID=2637762 RepID=UPI00278BF75F|nr:MULTISPECIES: NAD(P)-dependent oxidoreductase [unclassified Nocardia]
MIIGLLHPGNMGAAVGARLVDAGHQVLWCPDARSPATHDRAAAAGLTPTPDLVDLLARAETVISICPSSAAIEVAETVAVHRYRGIYVDANAVSPQRMQHIAGTLTQVGAAVVDAIISGPPPRDDLFAKKAKIFIAGPDPARSTVNRLFASGELETEELNENPWSASALKMAMISFLRPARMLAVIANGMADHYGVGDALTREAQRTGNPMLGDREFFPGLAARAWRWIPEAHEFAHTLAEAGLPTDYADATARMFAAYVTDKDDWGLSPAQVIQRLRVEVPPESMGEAYGTGPDRTNPA